MQGRERPWPLSRRAVVAGACAAVAAPGVRAIEPFVRPPGGRLRLGLAAYGYRKFFRWNKGQEQAPADPARALTLEGFVDLAADLGCDGAELTAYYFPPDIAPADLVGLRRRAFLRGIGISGLAVGNSFARPRGAELDREIAHVKQWVDRAALLGAPHVRVFAGALTDGVTKEQARDHCVAALEEVCDHAGRQGVMIGLENHGGIVATVDELMAIVRRVESPWFGVNLDTGNFHSADPYADVARAAAYAVNVQYKSEIRRAAAGAAEAADPRRVVSILRDAGYQGFVTLEYEAAESPFTAVPPLLAELRDLIG
jgi:sugar phosphate isomerase/epimerase